MSKLVSPAAERNALPIGDVLERVLPRAGLVLETASGTGVHTARFAERFPELEWQPSDVNDEAFGSIVAWCSERAVTNVRAPVVLDVLSATWPTSDVTAIININMLHIAPWPVCRGLMQGAARALGEGQLLYLYGPFVEEGRPTAASNLAFDRSLRARNSQWGIRQLEDVVAAARSAGLRLEEKVDMPANNLSLIFRSYPGQ